MRKGTVITLRIEPKLRKQLDRLAKAQGRAQSLVVAEAIREYVALNQWQIAEVRKALQAADRGEFSSAQRVRRVVSKWKDRNRIRRQ